MKTNLLILGGRQKMLFFLTKCGGTREPQGLAWIRPGLVCGTVPAHITLCFHPRQRDIHNEEEIETLHWQYPVSSIIFSAIVWFIQARGIDLQAKQCFLIRGLTMPILAIILAITQAIQSSEPSKTIYTVCLFLGHSNVWLVLRVKPKIHTHL
jgi:hypothetical protein